MTEFTTCFECEAPVKVDEWDTHECPPDPRNGPYDLDQFDLDYSQIDIDDDEEERDA